MHLLNNMMTSISEDRKPFKYEIISEQNEVKYNKVTNNFCTRHIKTRFNNILCVPVELMASLQNTLLLPYQALQVPVKYFIAKPLRCVAPKWKSFERLDENLAGIRKVTATAAKAIGYLVCSLLTLVLGSISPEANIWVHKILHLFSDKELKAKITEVSISIFEEQGRADTKLRAELEARETAEREAQKALEAQKRAANQTKVGTSEEAYPSLSLSVTDFIFVENEERKQGELTMKMLEDIKVLNKFE